MQSCCESWVFLFDVASESECVPPRSLGCFGSQQESDSNEPFFFWCHTWVESKDVVWLVTRLDKLGRKQLCLACQCNHCMKSGK